MSTVDAEEIRRSIENAVERREIACVSRVLALEGVDSTQNVAAKECDGHAGLLVLTRHQGAGRGRLGRTWADPGGKGVALTLTLRAEREAAARLPIAVGVAVAEAAAASLGILPSAGDIRIRWPNDVIENRRGRKLAGVLIESPQPGLFLIGIGVNVDQAETDWPAELTGRAVSLGQLGCVADAGRLVVNILMAIDRATGSGVTTESVLSRWQAFDALRGRRVTVSAAGREVTGIAEAIAPTSHLLIRTATGTERVPAATTSLLSVEGSQW